MPYLLTAFFFCYLCYSLTGFASGKKHVNQDNFSTLTCVNTLKLISWDW